MSTDLQAVESELVVDLGVADKAIAGLAAQYKDLKADTPANYQLVEQGRRECRRFRRDAKDSKAALKEKALAWNRAVDKEFRRVMGMISEVEEPLNEAKAKADEEIAAQRRAKEEAERIEREEREEAEREEREAEHKAQREQLEKERAELRQQLEEERQKREEAEAVLLEAEEKRQAEIRKQQEEKAQQRKKQIRAIADMFDAADLKPSQWEEAKANVSDLADKALELYGAELADHIDNEKKNYIHAIESFERDAARKKLEAEEAERRKPDADKLREFAIRLECAVDAWHEDHESGLNLQPPVCTTEWGKECVAIFLSHVSQAASEIQRELPEASDVAGT